MKIATLCTTLLALLLLPVLARNAPAIRGIVSSLAGSGTEGFTDGPGSAARFNSPYGVAYDGRGHVFVADRKNNRIRVIK